jgi:hypothetical protein
VEVKKFPYLKLGPFGNPIFTDFSGGFVTPLKNVAANKIL